MGGGGGQGGLGLWWSTGRWGVGVVRGVWVSGGQQVGVGGGGGQGGLGLWWSTGRWGWGVGGGWSGGTGSLVVNR